MWQLLRKVVKVEARNQRRGQANVGKSFRSQRKKSKLKSTIFIFDKYFNYGRSNILLSVYGALRYYYALENIINDMYDIECHYDIGKTCISFKSIVICYSS